VPATIEPDREKAVETANSTLGIRIATSSSVRKGKVGMGGAIHDTLGNIPNREPVTYSITVETRTKQNPHTAELAAIAIATRYLPPDLRERQITIFTSNQGVLLALSKPKHQSGQSSIGQVYDAVRNLRKGGNHICVVWVPTQAEFTLGKTAKGAARQATEQGHSPQEHLQRAKSTTINIEIAK
jgi:ribonuclease HI